MSKKAQPDTNEYRLRLWHKFCQKNGPLDPIQKHMLVMAANHHSLMSGLKGRGWYTLELGREDCFYILPLPLLEWLSRRSRRRIRVAHITPSFLPDEDERKRNSMLNWIYVMFKNKKDYEECQQYLALQILARL